MKEGVIWIGIATGAITIISSIWKVQKMFNDIEDNIDKLRYDLNKLIDTLDHRVDVAVMTANGYKERIDHNAQRHKAEEDKLHGRIDRNAEIIDDLENFIQKTTAYEKRHRR